MSTAAVVELDLADAADRRIPDDAIAVDVVALADGQCAVIAGVLEHVERAGVATDDGVCVLPPYSLGGDQVATVRRMTRALALSHGVVGLVNVRFAVRDDDAWVIGVEPGAERTAPFVSTATGVPLVVIAERVARGESLEPWTDLETRVPAHVAVQAADGVGIAADFPRAYAKALAAAGAVVPTSGTAFLAVKNGHVRHALVLAARLTRIGSGVHARPRPGVACCTSLDGAHTAVAAIEALRC